jgi:hypothetical protein
LVGVQKEWLTDRYLSIMECGGAKREEVTRVWRKVRDEELGDL